MPFLIVHKYKIIEAYVVDGGMLEKHDSRDDIDNMLTPERLTKLEFKDAPLEESVWALALWPSFRLFIFVYEFGFVAGSLQSCLCG